MVPVWLICAAGESQANDDMLHAHGAEIVPVPIDDHGLIDVQDALETLACRGITRVLIEGGPSVARAFLDADLVDEAVVYQAARPVGEDGLSPFSGDGLDRLTASGHFTSITSRSFGPDRMTWWRRMRTCSLELSAA
jgi:diaminohydroxyphosphoribosylaminopyrimidine deaminase/5-amino-6-(5-phosphoribosylamino)uracil reductase